MPLDIAPAVKLEATRVHDLVEISRAALPTKAGDFQIVAFATSSGEQLNDVAIIMGDLDPESVVPVRLHSECLTGDVFGSLRCDCGDQLQVAFERIAERGVGVVLYLRQEGRGIGIANKVRAYELQDGGLDTVEANLHLGFDDDARSYDTAAAMLHRLGIRRIELHTNNPRKVDGLVAAGIDVVRREPLMIAPRADNRHYLATKRVRSGHLLDE
ncbi:MAG: GTP cyclohydrolase II [Nannocystaceae bacterium]|nr:GTP cyclohydrolase II [Nannocystaceae bacterium]